MAPRPSAARPGSLSVEAAEDLRLLMLFFERRDQAIAQALKCRVRRNPLKDAIVRRMLVEFGDDHLLQVSDYQHELAHEGSRSAIRHEIGELEGLGALIVTQRGRDRRGRLVTPTQLIVTFYNSALPNLRDDAAKLLCRHHGDLTGMELWESGHVL